MSSEADIEMDVIFSAAGKVVKKWLKEDRNHKIRILHDYVAGTFGETVLGKTVPDYDCDTFSIKDRVLTIKATVGDPFIDGADFAPDKIGKLDLAKGYVPHDCGYRERKRMAEDTRWKAAGWTESSIRHLWDIVLGSGCKSSGKNQSGFWQSIANGCGRLYYTATHWFGGIYSSNKDAIHNAVKVVLISLSILGLSGCGGCSVPDGFEPSDDPVPYEVIVEP